MMVHRQFHDVGHKLHIQVQCMVGYRPADDRPILGIERITLVVILLVERVQHIREFLAPVKSRVLRPLREVCREVIKQFIDQARRQMSIHFSKGIPNHGDLLIRGICSIRLAKLADPGEKSF